MNLYSLAIFLGAFLLFQIQPMIARIILPWFGGSAAVWITCLLFFQVALLLGYVYVHAIARWLGPAQRRWMHLALLGASLALLPVIPDAAWKPTGTENPALRIVLVLAATVGLPYLALAATSPLVQVWYSERHADSPYRFFALSNAGSLLGLLTYPTLTEPFLDTRWQAYGWSGAYGAFCLVMGGLALRHGAAAAAQVAPAADDEEAPDSLTRFFWVALPACASALLLGVTNHLTQNVAAIPFLWVLPLSLYLLSFVFTFGRRSWYGRGFGMQLLAVALGVMAYALSPELENATLRLTVPLYLLGLFVCCLFCHGELAQRKPPAGWLTSYYLMISLGGAVGGLFVSVLSPLIYRTYHELPISMAACAVLGLLVLHLDPGSRFYRVLWSWQWLGLMLLVAVLIASLMMQALAGGRYAGLMVRNFYGAMRVVTVSGVRVFHVGQPSSAPALPPGASYRKLLHGTIDHGIQYDDAVRRRTATAYYVPTSGVGLALREAMPRGPMRVGVVGLGTGTLAVYGRPEDMFRFYEINPLVQQIATTEFSYLRDTPAKVEVVLGDARLVMEREAPQKYDVLAVDAFSGDAIPVHLLTREAMELYFRHLRPGGALAIHVSNLHVDLQPVVERVAHALGKRVVVVESVANDAAGVFRAYWVLVSDRADFFLNAEIQRAGQPIAPRADLAPWSDAYSNLLQVLR
jgi:hypothetical protein